MTNRRYVSLLFICASVGSFSAVASASAPIKCESPNLLAEFEPEVVTQLIKAQGERTTPRGNQFAAETVDAFVQVRALESSGVRDYQVRSTEAYRGGDVATILLRDPQLVKISGGGLMRPLYIALPSVIDLRSTELLDLEKRVESRDPSRADADVVITSLAVNGTTLVYSEKLLRRRPGGHMDGDARSTITSASTRTLEMRGERHGSQFLVKEFVLTTHEPQLAGQNVSRVSVQLPQPLVLAVHP